jgi:hypothetical protein
LLDTPEEGLKSKVNTAGDILQNLRMNGFEFGMVFLPPCQCGNLCVERRGFETLFVKGSSLVYHTVVDKAADSQRFI